MDCIYCTTWGGKKDSFDTQYTASRVVLSVLIAYVRGVFYVFPVVYLLYGAERRSYASAPSSELWFDYWSLFEVSLGVIS